MPRQVHIDVYSDLICPWCLIGKQHLRQALAQAQAEEPDLQVTVQWHAVQLVAGVPDEGWDYPAFYLRRLGSAAMVHTRQAQVREAAARAGVEIHFERITRIPNTAPGHQLLAYAAQHLAPAQLDALMERLFSAFFQRGEHIGQWPTLLSIATEFSLDTRALQDWIANNQGLPEQVEVPGVPFFVFNRAQALSGAQPPATLLAAIRQTAIETTPHAVACTL
ncbi:MULTISPECIES: DsbA family oxidoreductase [Giesbergeria]|uniref:DsbA family oxidoreductase n=1 Tax=Giesbergeria sinuosa TaxID=80883 RepID=A0ABV9QHD2_9BURK